MINSRILGTMLIAASVLLVTIDSQNAMASLGLVNPQASSDVDVEETEEAKNVTMTATENQTTNGNMTGTNSTS